MSSDCRHCPNCRCARAGKGLAALAPAYKDILHESPQGLRHITAAATLDALQRIDLGSSVLITSNHCALSSMRSANTQWRDIELNEHPALPELALSACAVQSSLVTYIPQFERAGRLDTVQVYDRKGMRRHQVVFGKGLDISPVTALEALPPQTLELPSDHKNTGNVDYAMANVINARANWDTQTPHWHINHFAQDDGQTRCTVLPHMGERRAKSVPVDSMLLWLADIHNEGLIYSRIVPGDLWIQADASDVLGLGVQHANLSIHSSQGVMVLNLTSIGQCWVTRFKVDGKPLSFVEIYTKSGECAALFAPYRHYLIKPWLDFTEDLAI